ncbi:hypothetical protein HPP92_022383 [Vanilla planifolia]|uniref:Glycosyltransferase family 92 protein n=1 Tax=Vanilla planifolia TaxID=51239 RepID=A0A835PV96_VANPL|nr:hypothetical protein HPP92_022383 [Vanilla planifolia]
MASIKLRRKSLTAIFAGSIAALVVVCLTLNPSAISFGGAGTPQPQATNLRSRLVQRKPNFAVSNSDLSFLPSLNTPAVLLPDWEVILLPPRFPHSPPVFSSALLCLFPNGAASSASPIGSNSAVLCSIPHSVRRFRPIPSPILSVGGSAAVDHHALEMFRWNHIAYESLSTTRDVILFAKGVNNRQGVNRPPIGMRCVFSVEDVIVATTHVTSSVQEVFRCLHPNQGTIPLPSRVSIDAGDGRGPLPSLAVYRKPSFAQESPPRRLICACTMLYNVAKFLREWVTYHSAIGVDRFLLYDNGSNDGLKEAVRRLGRAGFDVQSRFWPWAKTQEAGFSHCVIENRDQCEWIAFLDVDEFLFRPAWKDVVQPNQTMIRSIMSTGSNIGQVSIQCLDFGPSGHRVHPHGGVTQGYTCRRATNERHKSLVRPKAVASSLANSVHHFQLGQGWKTIRLTKHEVVVNHYKYQAWEEFRSKFRRRVSAYVVDWKQTLNPGSKDRTPGLGFEPVEPKDWVNQFCEVNDTQLRDVTRAWFGKIGLTNDYSMAWE